MTTDHTQNDDFLAAIARQLESPIIRQRRAAIETLDQRMQQGEYLLDGLKILQEVAKSDDVLIIADLAAEKLRRYQTLAAL